MAATAVSDAEKIRESNARRNASYDFSRYDLTNVRTGSYRVRSEEDKYIQYSVELIGTKEWPNGRCDCKDFIYRAGPMGINCKHLWAVINLLGEHVRPYVEPKVEAPKVNASIFDSRITTSSEPRMLISVPVPLTLDQFKSIASAADSLKRYGETVLVTVGEVEDKDGNVAPQIVFGATKRGLS